MRTFINETNRKKQHQNNKNKQGRLKIQLLMKRHDHHQKTTAMNSDSQLRSSVSH